MTNLSERGILRGPTPTGGPPLLPPPYMVAVFAAFLVILMAIFGVK